MLTAVRLAFPAVLVASITSVAQAHPHHAHTVVPADSGWHFLLQPEHALVWSIGLATLLGIASSMVYRAKSSRQQPARAHVKSPSSRFR